jgi:hypothetical protein
MTRRKAPDAAWTSGRRRLPPRSSNWSRRSHDAGEPERLFVDISPRVTLIAYPAVEQVILIHRRMPIFWGVLRSLQNRAQQQDLRVEPDPQERSGAKGAKTSKMASGRGSMRCPPSIA